MYYFQPYFLPADQTILAAWDSQLAELSDFPELVTALAKRRELFPRFAEYYRQLRALPRGTRRALQRKLARARELISIQPEWQQKLARSLAGAALLLALAQSASAATITVTTNVPDINDGDGQCSLFEAIINANNDTATHPDCAAGDGADTIVLPSESKFPDTAAAITSVVTIEGNRSAFSRARFVVLTTGNLIIRNVGIYGGTFCFFNYGGALTIESSIVSGCRAHDGAALYNTGSVSINNSVLSSNKADGNPEYPWTGSGGAIFNRRGTISISNSTISDNAAYGNLFGNAGGGGIENSLGTVVIENSTISGNTAVGHNFKTGYGGGISNSGRLIIQNSTISGNKASGGNSRWDRNSRGGGVVSGGYLLIEDSTITYNSATGGLQPVGGGLVSYSVFSTAILRRNIISGNEAINSPEVLGSSSFQADFNLFGTNGNAGVDGFTPGPTDIVPTVPLTQILGPLQDNGGPTLTHALVPDSPAIDAAPVDANCPATDQRGVARPQGAGCDIGAVESVPSLPPPPLPQPTAHNFIVTSVKAPKSIKHGGGTAAVAVTIRNAGTNRATLSSASVLGDGATTGLVRLAIDVIDTDGEQCEPAAVSLNGSKNAKLFSNGVKVLKAGASLTVNFLVTYRCDAPLPASKRNPEAGDFSNSASVFPDELDGISASTATSTLAGAATKVTF